MAIAAILILFTTQNVDAVVSCPSISGWTTYNQFQGTTNSYTCEYESYADPIYGTNYGSLSVQWYDNVPQYVDTGSGSWCSGDSGGGTHYSSARFVLVSYDQYHSEFYDAGITMLRNAESAKIGSSCTQTGGGSLCSDPKYPYYNSATDRCHSNPCFDSEYPYYNSATDRCHSNPCFDSEYPYYNSKTNKCYTTSQSPDDWNDKGNELFDQGKHEEAIVAYDKAISLDPNYKWAWYNKGLVLNDIKKYQDALTALNRVLQLDPNYQGANFEKGYALGELGRYDESIKAYQKEMKLDPTDKGALLNMGWSLNQLEKYEEAIPYFDKALKIDPNYALAKENKEYSLEQIASLQTTEKLLDFLYEADKMEQETSEFLDEMEIFLDGFSTEFYDEEYDEEWEEQKQETLDLLEQIRAEREAEELREFDERMKKLSEELKKMRLDMQRMEDGTYEYYQLKESIEQELAALYYDLKNTDWEYEIKRTPEWIKNNARWWSEGDIDDKTFKQGIQYMIKENIINIETLPERTAEKAAKIPDWVKNNAKWWADGIIGEDDFVNSIKYMVEKGIIQVD